VLACCHDREDLCETAAIHVTDNPVLNGPRPIDPAIAALRPQANGSRLHGPARADMDFSKRANSNFRSNIVSEIGSKDFAECLVRL